MRRQKDQGTAAETETVRRCQKAGLQAWRLAEGGSNDPGDVVVVTPEGDHHIVESKHCQNLPVHAALAKAREKAAKADVPFLVAGVALRWRRSIPDPEGGRRKPAGVVFVLDEGYYLRLLGGAE